MSEDTPQEQEKQPAPEGEAQVKTLILEFDGVDIKVKSNFKDVFLAVAILERAKFTIQMSERDEAARARAQSLILDKLQMAKRPN